MEKVTDKFLEDFQYDPNSKSDCWYKEVCDKSQCGSNFCIRHYKMEFLTYAALLEGRSKYPVKLVLDKDGTDRDPYTFLKGLQVGKPLFKPGENETQVNYEKRTSYLKSLEEKYSYHFSVTEGISDFVKNGKNLLIYSEGTGNGKSAWSKKLLLSWLDSIWPFTDFTCRGLFVSVPSLLRNYVSNVSNFNETFNYIDENIYDADLVVWDEICSKDYTEFEHAYLLNVINSRMERGKANIFTTNYNLDTINKKLGTRLGSRVIGSSIKVEFKGGDKRGWGI